MRTIKKTMAAILCAALVISLVPAGSADAAKKKAKLSSKKVTVEVGKTVKVKVKNSVKKAKVTWKTSDKAVAAITKKVAKGKKASATIKGVKEGTATIKAVYKVGKKKTTLKCKVTVTNAAKAEPTIAASVAPTTAVQPSAPAATTAPTKKPTVKPTRRPTASPTPVPTPTPVPDPDAQIYKTYVDITVDGTAEDTWDFADAMPIDNFNIDADQEDTGNDQTSNAAAKMLWTDSYLYILVTADDPEIDLTNETTYLQDSIELFIDKNNNKKDYAANEFQYRLVINPNEDEENPAGEFTDKNSWEGEPVQYGLTTSETGYVVEFAVPLDEAPVVNNFIGVDIQINDASAGARNGTWNLFADPANGDELPYNSTAVLGDCQYALKKQAKVITLDLTEDTCNMELPNQFKDNEEYATMNTLSKVEEGKLFCNTANNATVYFPEGRIVNNGEKAVVKITGTYESTNEEQTAAFRIWMVDTKERTLKGDNPVTTSNQIAVNKEDLNVDEDGKFEIEVELTAIPGTATDADGNSVDSEGNCDGVMIKAPTWNTMIENLVIESVVITVEDPIRNDVTEETPEGTPEENPEA